MCRLFGHRALDETSVQHELLEANNALRVQSREHPDGWGLGWYVGGAPQVARALEPAHADADFAAVGEFLASRTIIAHVRKASVGRVALENTHPFEWGRWLFVHNGTVPRWAEARPVLERAIDPSLRGALQGETDSERCFFAFLSRLMRRCDPLDAPVEHAAAALAETVALVRAASEPAETPASTTFLATDGERMVACRRGRTLFVEIEAAPAGGRARAVTIASERPCVCAGRSYREVPEDGLVAVDRDLRVTERRLSDAAAAA